jgi:hypothetical protein
MSSISSTWPWRLRSVPSASYLFFLRSCLLCFFSASASYLFLFRFCLLSVPSPLLSPSCFISTPASYLFLLRSCLLPVPSALLPLVCSFPAPAFCLFLLRSCLLETRLVGGTTPHPENHASFTQRGRHIGYLPLPLPERLAGGLPNTRGFVA